MYLLNLITDAYAMGPAPQGGGQGDPIMSLVASLLPLVLIIVVFYFLLIRPQQKRAKEHRQMLENLKRGDKVITVGGLYGVVDSVNPNTVVLKVAENVKLKFSKQSIAALRPATDED
ncbi:preprotein translocase subunit YajC [Thermodesulfovibrio yellowstonii]|uniref:Sec translocon accessory complex subunit YajC n=1 Tax=Thermodesulfovibrio yellowstonii TaxID=28262 RepID=A0A9W6LKP6_9BACT|nr:preprotein translocase subunit YajC [Thermodesulfovibrio islandicus]GLI54466.1 preprotein translocase subunit YajC [Thermodesulfovibrio islandicus]